MPAIMNSMGPRQESAREYGVVPEVVLDFSSGLIISSSFFASGIELKPAGFGFEPCCAFVEGFLLFAALILVFLIFEDGGVPRAGVFCPAIMN
jgi:hypothetical protein